MEFVKYSANSHGIPLILSTLHFPTQIHTNPHKPTHPHNLHTHNMTHRINVHVIRARDLKREDGAFGKNDPYVEVSIGHTLLGGKKYKTATQKDTAGEVVFDESFTFDAKPSDTLKVKVYDDDVVSDDDIGSTKIPLDTLFQQGQVKQFYQIGEGSKVRGQVELHLSVLN